jgi:hypothetical protein
MSQMKFSNVVEGVEIVEPQLKIEIQKVVFMEIEIFYQFIFLKDSIYIWLGTRTAEMNNFHVSTKVTKFVSLSLSLITKAINSY